MNNENKLYNKNERNTIEIKYGNDYRTQLYINDKEVLGLDGFYIEVDENMVLPKIELRVSPSIIDHLK